MTHEEKLVKRKLYRDSNKILIKQRAALYYSKNTNAVKLRHRNWVSNNPEKLKQYHEDTKLHKQELAKQQRINNKEHIKEASKVYRKQHELEIKISGKIYRQTNREVLREKQKEKRRSDFLFRLRQNISTLIRNSLFNNSYKKYSKTQNILDCTYPYFKKYLESQFESWMNWENYGKCDHATHNVGWDIDHIIPISSGTTEAEILLLNHYTNLQSMCSYTDRHIKRHLLSFCRNQ